MESDQLIRPAVFTGAFAVFRTLDREAREAADLDLADYLILSHAVLATAGAPVRLLPGELCLAPDLVAAKSAALTDAGFLARIRDRDDRRAFSLVATEAGAALWEITTGALGLRLRALWRSVPEAALNGAVDTLAGISGVGGTLGGPGGGYDSRVYAAALVLQTYVRTCTDTAHRLGVTSAGCGVLLLLGSADLGAGRSAGLPVDELTTRIGLARTASIPTRAMLERGGFIEHIADESEDSAPLIRLTPLGRTFYAELAPALLEALASSPLKLAEEAAAALATVATLVRA